ncbi:MAG TPA: cellulose synthase operon protein YhjQ/BcsQ, partial [Burkholderiaceae bacterium]
ALLNGQEWQTAAFRSAGGLDFLPFGELANERDLDRLQQKLAQQSGWFRAQLAGLQLDADTIVLCDCPRAYPALREQVLARADLVLLICGPDVVSYAYATQMLANIKASPHGPESMIVLNAFEPTRRLDRDIAVLLRTGFKDRLSPAVLHRDEFLREALACKQTIFEFAPSSQAAYDFAALATWVMARLGHTEATHAH